MKATLVVTGIAAGIGIALAGAGVASADGSGDAATAPSFGLSSLSPVHDGPLPGDAPASDLQWGTGDKADEGLRYAANPFVGKEDPLGFLFTGKSDTATATALQGDWTKVVDSYGWDKPDFADGKYTNFAGFNGSDLHDQGAAYAAYDEQVFADIFDKGDVSKWFGTGGADHFLAPLMTDFGDLQAFDAALGTDMYAALLGAITPQDLGVDLFGAGTGATATEGLFTGLFDGFDGHDVGSAAADGLAGFDLPTL